MLVLCGSATRALLALVAPVRARQDEELPPETQHWLKIGRPAITVDLVTATSRARRTEVREEVLEAKEAYVGVRKIVVRNIRDNFDPLRRTLVEGVEGKDRVGSNANGMAMEDATVYRFVGVRLAQEAGEVLGSDR